jgi:hypothetical protein
MADYRRRRRRRRGHLGVERRSGRIHPLFLLLTAVGVVAIAFATLCPLELRPRLGDANVERFGAYFIVGFTAALAAPRRVTLVSVSLVVLAFGLEAAQRLAPGRDAVLTDAVVKGFGAMLGAQIGVMTFAGRRWLRGATQAYRASRRARRGGMRLQPNLPPTLSRL